jgi:hypothetical protein
MPSGPFQGGRIDSKPVVPVAFNTGQILIGLVAGQLTFGGYRDAFVRAADWLVEAQDPDGCWRKGSSPFAGPGEKTYDTHIAWGLYEAARVERGRGYEEAATANVRWALSHQQKNGWMARCCLSNAAQPLSHTVGYALRGIIEAYRFTGDTMFLEAACRMADGLITALGPDGFLPGRLKPDWTGAVKWSCVTGNAQIAICWLKLFQDTGNCRYRDAALLANKFVRRTVRFTGPAAVVGGVRGSFPIDGAYSRYEYPNWAAKFVIDSLWLESDILSRGGSPTLQSSGSTSRDSSAGTKPLPLSPAQLLRFTRSN